MPLINRPQPTAQPARVQGQQSAQNPGDIQRRLVLAVMKIIYTPKISKALLKVLRQGKPENAVARAALFVLQQLLERAKGVARRQVFELTPAVVGFLFDLGEKAGVLQNDPAAAKAAIALVMQQANPTQPDRGMPAQRAMPAQQPAPTQGTARPMGPQGRGLIGSQMMEV